MILNFHHFSSIEWPFFDVFAPCVTSWIYAIGRFSESLARNMTAVDEWIDFALISLLMEVMDCNNSQVRSVCARKNSKIVVILL